MAPKWSTTLVAHEVINHANTQAIDNNRGTNSTVCAMYIYINKLEV